MAQERFHIAELDGLGLRDYRNIPAIAERICKQFGMLDLWWFILGQVHHESLVFDDTKRDYKASAPYFNIMGMRPAKVRNTYQKEGSIQGKGQYAQYDNYADAIADLCYWLKINKILEGFQIQKLSPEGVNYARLLKQKKYMTGNEASYNTGIINAQNKYGQVWLKYSEKPFFDSSVVTETNAGSTTEEVKLGPLDLSKFGMSKMSLVLIILVIGGYLWNKYKAPKQRKFNKRFRRR